MLPPGWRVRIARHNSLMCGVAHSRPRIFIIGTCPAMHKSYMQRLLLDAPLPSVSPVSLMHFLDFEADDRDFEGLPASCGEAPVGCVDCGRDTFKGYDSNIAIDAIQDFEQELVAGTGASYAAHLRQVWAPPPHR